MSDDYVHSIQGGIEVAGDPYDIDVIVMFCNGCNTHWYLTILNKCPDKMCVVHFDSGPTPPNSLKKRCSFLIKFINDFRAHVRKEYSLNWPKIRDFRDSKFDFRDGHSIKQENSFDCGVYALVNAESYIANCDHTIYTEKAMPLARMVAIQSLLTIASTPAFPFSI